MTQFRLTQTLKQALAFLFIWLSSPSLSQTFELSLEEGRVAARQAALQGQFELARDFALALTDADADDRDALIVLAAVQPKLGAARDGRRAGVRAFRLSQTDDERYEAARLTALAAANEERYTLSQIWLRRAAVNAPDERAFRQTQQDYRGVRNLNPWSVRLGFSITPSSNVNGGTDSEFNIIDGVTNPDGTPLVGVFSGAARALPGTIGVADVRLAYDVSRSAQRRTTLGARAYARAVWLNNEARTIAPDSRNSDFGSQILEFSLDHSQRAGVGTVSAQALIGASWFGGDLSRTYLRGRLGYAIPVGERTRLSVVGRLESIDLNTTFPRTNQDRSLSTTLTHFTDTGNRITAALSVSGQSSEQPNERFESVTGQITYTWADPIGPIELSVAAGVSLADYRDYTILVPVPGGRQDTRIFGSISAVFPGIDYAGFVPVVTLGVQDTQSNVSRFQRDEYSLNIGVRSSF
ncbi:hypothetical protein [Octadecabacter dasysiphoniae]|uniref:hypothetical protein n=1 Tax=Octadecabacter dasysiphoniae TaxID=2909341 RepID=UPI001F2D1E48|nr:hypothetical protein [Octadecabacter dasysiphoniae]